MHKVTYSVSPSIPLLLPLSSSGALMMALSKSASEHCTALSFKFGGCNSCLTYLKIRMIQQRILNNKNRTAYCKVTNATTSVRDGFSPLSESIRLSWMASSWLCVASVTLTLTRESLRFAAVVSIVVWYMNRKSSSMSIYCLPTAINQKARK